MSDTFYLPRLNTPTVQRPDSVAPQLKKIGTGASARDTHELHLQESKKQREIIARAWDIQATVMLGLDVDLLSQSRRPSLTTVPAINHWQTDRQYDANVNTP